jgi:hypothetical protein
MEDEEFPGQNIIDSLDQDVSDALVRFGNKVDAAGKDLLEKVQLTLNDFELTQGNLKASVSNLRRINDVRRTLNAAQADGKYSAAVQDLVAQLNVQAAGLNAYFSALRVGFAGGKKLYGAIVEEYTTATVAQLYTGAFGATLEPELTSIITTHLTSGAPIKLLRQQVSAQFAGNSTLTSRAEAIADNALNQFSRNYMQAVTDDLGLKHYFFKGTLIATSRPFCRQRTGKYFTEAEVLDWADLDFAGKIKGTDRSNIKTNLGGNRCRHRLVPITEELYNVKTGRAGQLALSL